MKHMILTGLLATSILTGAAVSATAEQKGGHGPHMDFEKVDTNTDGQLSQEEVMAHRKAHYMSYDQNGDAQITAEEMRAAMQAYAAEKVEKRVSKMMKHHDADKDGVLSEAEITPKKAGRMFKHADADGDGMISREEFDAMEAKREKRKNKG